MWRFGYALGYVLGCALGSSLGCDLGSHGKHRQYTYHHSKWCDVLSLFQTMSNYFQSFPGPESLCFLLVIFIKCILYLMRAAVAPTYEPSRRTSSTALAGGQRGEEPGRRRQGHARRVGTALQPTARRARHLGAEAPHRQWTRLAPADSPLAPADNKPRLVAIRARGTCLARRSAASAADCRQPAGAAPPSHARAHKTRAHAHSLFLTETARRAGAGQLCRRRSSPAGRRFPLAIRVFRLMRVRVAPAEIGSRILSESLVSSRLAAERRRSGPRSSSSRNKKQ